MDLDHRDDLIFKEIYLRGRTRRDVSKEFNLSKTHVANIYLKRRSRIISKFATLNLSPRPLLEVDEFSDGWTIFELMLLRRKGSSIASGHIKGLDEYSGPNNSAFWNMKEIQTIQIRNWARKLRLKEDGTYELR